jgi:CRISPR-associated protein Csb2
MLSLEIGFPGGRYYAADHSDPRNPEWPPHPSRVFSALVAAAYGGHTLPDVSQCEALLALEAAGDPSVEFPPADLKPAPDSYVPVNDRKTRVEARKRQSLGIVEPNRQVRQFPAAFLLGEPHVRFTWSVDPPDVVLEALDTLASRMTHLGTSHSLVTARFSRTPRSAEPKPEDGHRHTLVPDRAGVLYLRVPRPGRLAELDRLAAEGYGTLRRPLPVCEVLAGFTADEPVATPPAEGLLDWVAVRWTEAVWGADTAHTLARAFRAAVMGLLGDEAPACVHGHDPQVPHVAWLPLAEVGHSHARGRLRGLAMAVPTALPAQEKSLALAGLARLRHVQLPDGQVARVEALIEGPDTPVTLQGRTWRGPDTDWSTVTPVLLDRPPKRQTHQALEAAVRESLCMAGFPDPVRVAVSTQSDFTGSPTVYDIPTRVPRFHVRVRFAHPLHGPLVAGRWRHFGVGLFRPTPIDLRWD